MAKVRQDAWSHEDDLLLAETVLRHIREGSTQLKAFEEVGDHLNRTSAACGFRWNAEVRNKYISAIDLAKRQRKEKKRRLAKEQADRTTAQPQPVALTSTRHQDQEEQNDSHNIDTSNEATAWQIPESEPLTIDSVIEFLTHLKNDYNAANQSKASISRLQDENEHLQQQVDHLTQQLKQTENELTTVKDDYQVFMQIMDRARKMTVFEDQGTMKTPAFRMDKNGNLEQIAQSSSQ
ncbi:Prespore-specific transcriptional regulator RsfA [Lentibacillus sp. JNUCC-1]|uniref:RsfA family transcriptional regulator n=1 Tax=Lentibacillus sp. JNUCC-1 TaxID=2654513 RepID=UPI0013293256|nr:Prespore-specific transcriptional regulator RsfA [Lentibacillus sp. JNUCC-1]